MTAPGVIQRSAEIFKRIASIPAPVGAEIGIAAGDMSLYLLHSRPDLSLVMVDNYLSGSSQHSTYIKSGDYHAKLNAQEQANYQARAMERTNFAGIRRQFLIMDSTDAAGRFDDHSFDFVFIDGDHSLEGCRQDLEAWADKVKPGRWLCGHDIDLPDHPHFGVRPAVEQFTQSRGLKFTLGANYTWFIEMP